MENILQLINQVVWGVPTVILIVCVGVYFTLQTRFFQFRYLPRAIALFFRKLKPRPTDEKGVSPYAALCTALAATVGTGNIVGVAGAILLGGPGAVFWMWVCALLGMIIKCAEASMAVHFRQKDSNGEYIGGPMYIIRQGMGEKWKPLASLYAAFGLIAAFGVGNITQIDAVLGAIHNICDSYAFHAPAWLDWAVVGILAVLLGILLAGGAKRIGSFAEALVPYASVLYILLGIGVLLVRCQEIPGAFRAILSGAFAPEAVTGGVVGSMLTTCRIGAARGVFTNEAGMGTASIAHASAQVNHPVEQGLLGIVEVFIDTIVICTVTALVILCSRIPIPYGTQVSTSLTAQALASVFGNWTGIVLAVCLVCFAFATVMGWGLYGLRCAQFLFGDGKRGVFVCFQVVTVLLAAVFNTSTVWLLAETINGLMCIPNLIALLCLCPTFFRLVKSYQTKVPGTPTKGYQGISRVYSEIKKRVPSSLQESRKDCNAPLD